jgi:hypothetical protein
MEYQTRTYFKENEAEDVKGFTVIDTNEESGECHIAEKWSREDTQDKWLQYWIPESQLLSRVEAGKCVEAAELTDEQFEAVCEKIDHEKVAAPVEA